MMALVGISALVELKVANVEDRRSVAWGARQLRLAPRNLTAAAAAAGGGRRRIRRSKSKSKSAVLSLSDDSSEVQESIFVPESPENIETEQYNAVFISDTHLGTPGCQVGARALQLASLLPNNKGRGGEVVVFFLGGWEGRKEGRKKERKKEGE